MNYQTLKRALSPETATRWLVKDAADDFFPDSIALADLRGRESAYAVRQQHRWLQFDNPAHWVDYVPKRSRLLREAVILHPLHRVAYLAILRHFIAKLDRQLQSASYSYRLDRTDDGDEYPFSHRIERWKTFHNDFRTAALEPGAKVVVLTDLAAFYDHISCDQLCERIGSLLGPAKTEEDDAVLLALQRLLRMWCTDGHGIPQNHDPSSFFGSLYLNGIDHEMIAGGFRYFRWVDDIRIVASSHDEAIQALHFLQRLLAKCRLFLATEKTEIVNRDQPRYNSLLDVSDDIRISEVEEQIRASDCISLRGNIGVLFERLAFHSGPNGDDRKFRAFANRLLDIAAFDSLAEAILPRLEQFVIPRLRSHPDRTDYWVRLLSATASQAVTDSVVDLLVTNESLFSWQKFHLWRLALYLPRPLPEILISRAKAVAGSYESDAVAAQAIVLLGAVSNNTERESLFNANFTRQRSYLVQRATVIAIQELPVTLRDRLYELALAWNADHTELIEYLRTQSEPNYGISRRQARTCPETPTVVAPLLRRGVGLVNGIRTTFRLSSSELDYE
ncbi:MAG: RNA-directed DNA polymerase [bacterium]|jgi:hypothetical protein|uniref:RNA-directed DNA polymerase n=2 Tax=Gemmatimonas sp. TaxID=1962908 RepID=UPI0025C22113|nr:RNA-directed DNA polymerase [Gemmatimonas sp.]MCE2953336.1 RNA-directed DNA polymerase [Gemmatimonas sp.]